MSGSVRRASVGAALFLWSIFWAGAATGEGAGEAAPAPPPMPDGAAEAATPEPAVPFRAPAEPASADTRRFFVDGRVTDIRVEDDLTVATLVVSASSPCPSDEYVFERNRPKWLFQTGRLLQAMREGALVRLSFQCVDGLQSINAIQFLSAPTSAVAEGMPRPGEVVRVDAETAAAEPRAIPLPTPAAGASQTLDERVRTLPRP